MQNLLTDNCLEKKSTLFVHRILHVLLTLYIAILKQYLQMYSAKKKCLYEKTVRKKWGGATNLSFF